MLPVQVIWSLLLNNLKAFYGNHWMKGSEMLLYLRIQQNIQCLDQMLVSGEREEVADEFSFLLKLLLFERYS